jgi:DNA-binding response OmpR family regulator
MLFYLSPVFTMAPQKILLVEDEDLIRLLLTEALTDEGFLIISAATGEEAVVLISNGEDFDVLFTDIQLPGTVDGLDIARFAREKYPSVPVVFTTGQPDRMSGWHIGANDIFIPKPYRPAEISRAVRQVLGLS